MKSDISSRPSLPLNEKDFPKEGSAQEKLEFVLRYAIMASSFYDSEPWQFSINDQADEIDIYADRSRWLHLADPDQRELYISLGCALENLLTAIDYFDMGHKSVAYMPEPGNEDLAVRVKISTAIESQVPRQHRLFSSISHGNSVIRSFKDKALSKEDLSDILGFLGETIYEDSTMRHRVKLDIIDDKQQMNRLVELVSENDVSLFSNGDFRSELANVLSQGELSNTLFYEEFNSLESGPTVAKKVAEKESNLIGKAPVVGILSSNIDDATAAIKVGQAIERVTLEANAKGVGVYPVFQLLGTKEMRSQVQKVHPHLHGFPQLMFVMGVIQETVKSTMTPRIPLEAVMRKVA